MDCEKFDEHVIDALYDELDEQTSAALRRHVEGCARCADVYNGLRNTREAAVLPLAEPSDDLEDRILSAAQMAQSGVPMHHKFLRVIAWAGSHAMRPQLAMAAIFMLVVGSSLLLLRVKPGSGGAPVAVSQRGVPAAAEAPEDDFKAGRRARSQAMAPGEDPSDAPMAFGRAEPKKSLAKEEDAEAEAAADADEAKDDANSNADAQVLLAEARSERDGSGCPAAVSKYDAVATRYPGTTQAHAAMWEAAKCYEAMGEQNKARSLYLAVRADDAYRDRADEAIAASEGNMQQNVASAPGAGAPAAAAKPARKAKAPAPAPYAAPEATTGGATKQGVAGPERSMDGL